MKSNLFLLLLLSITLLFGCEKEKSTPAKEKAVALTEKQKLLVQKTNTFGFDFFRRIHSISGSDHNLMVSPLSVSMAFGMARNGGSGTTLEEMNQTLGMQGLSDTEINETYKYILETFSSLDPEVQIAIANSIWYDKNFNVLQEFLDTNQDYFHAEVNPLDFANPGAKDEINGWVSDKTKGLIPTIIDEIPEAMVMYLINAVYFKGQWQYAFEKDKTRDMSFYKEVGNAVETPFMVQETNLNYFDGENFKAVELPYNQGNFNMVVMLPDEGISLENLVSQLSQENWNSWYSRFSENLIQLYLPKFKFAYEEKKMKQAMAEMGMPSAFIPELADFTRINPEGNIFISEVKHKTFIETNEEGTEAAAVTSIGFETTSVGTEPQPTPFIADKPFVFFIHEKSSGSILFIGTITNPKPSE